MSQNRQQFKKGMWDGIPICLGYLAVSFTFGIAAQGVLTPLQATLMAAMNYTSAGQFAALDTIRSGAPYVELAIAQLIINLRYCLMSCALSQKLDSSTPFIHRFLLACGITDEVFGVSACQPGYLNPYYSYGIMSLAMPGWVLGTLLGSVLGSVMPARILSALGIALYTMFIAIIIPPAKKSSILTGVIIVSMAVSFLFDWIPLTQISGGTKIILITVIVAGLAAVLFPLEPQEVPVKTKPVSHGGIS